MREDITMSRREANRISVLEQLKKGEIKQIKAAEILGLGTRQVRRLQERYEQQGGVGLVHKSRGRRSNRATNRAEIKRATNIVNEKYSDFGPTFAHEKLVELHGITFGVDVLRQAMIEEKIWIPKRRKKPRIHQLRERRANKGELVQLDGSPHDWFESRDGSLPCTLLNAVDDADSEINHVKFVESENLFAYFGFVEEYFLTRGKPVAWYVDKHGVFRVNRSNKGQSSVSDSQALTQFSRAMKQVSVGMIFANTPQAKGRVERSNQTLQDRLVKEMRLRGINNLETGNEYLPEFIKDYNQKFGVKAKKSEDLHRPVTAGEKLAEILVRQEERVISKNLTCQYKNIVYQIQTNRPSYAMRRAKVKIHEDKEGTIKVYYRGKEQQHTVIKRREKSQIIDSKQLNAEVDKLKKEQKVKDQQLSIWDTATGGEWEAYYCA